MEDRELRSLTIVSAMLDVDVDAPERSYSMTMPRPYFSAAVLAKLRICVGQSRFGSKWAGVRCSNRHSYR